MYEIGLLACCFPGKGAWQSSKPTDAFQANRRCIAIETLFVTSPNAPLHVSSVLQSKQLWKAEDGDRHQICVLLTSSTGDIRLDERSSKANHDDDDSYPTLLSVRSPVADDSRRLKRNNSVPRNIHPFG